MAENTVQKEEKFEFELLVDDSPMFKRGTWIPITKDRIKDPSKIDKYIQNGILRRIERPVESDTQKRTIEIANFLHEAFCVVGKVVFDGFEYRGIGS